MAKIKRIVKLLLGMDPILLDADQRTQKMQITVNSEDKWFLVCRPYEGCSDKIVECGIERRLYVRAGKNGTDS